MHLLKRILSTLAFPLLHILALLTLTPLLTCCYYLGQNTYADIVVNPSTVWSSPEVLTLVMEASNNNLRDFRNNVKVIATPYYPSVVKAIGRRGQFTGHWSEEGYREFVDALLFSSSGMLVDWEKDERIFAGRSGYLTGPEQYDSLTFLVSMQNWGWPCVKLLSVGGRTIGIGNPDCDVPEMANFEEKVLLVNEENKFIRPVLVWGIRQNALMNEETIFLKFRLRSGEHHFLEHSSKMFLVFKGFGDVIRLEYSTALMR